MIAAVVLAGSLFLAVADAPLASIERIGSTLGELDRSANACKPAGRVTVCRPWGDITHLGLPAREMALEYRDEHLATIRIIFDESRFPVLADRLRDVLGPGESRDERLRAGMGGVIDNRILVWHSNGRVVMLEQYSAKVTLSSLRYSTLSAFDDLMRERDRRRIRDLRDL